MSRTKQDGSKQKLHSCYDLSLLFITLFLVGFGLLMIYSTSSYTAMVKFSGDSMHFVKRQALCAAIGIVAMLIVSKIDYRIYIKKLPIIRIRPVTLLYLVSIALQILVLVIGQELNGAKRWIIIGPLNFQPSEISKVAVVLFVAYIIHVAPRKLDHFSGFVRVLIFMVPLLGLIGKENLSTAIVITAITVGVCFIASRKKGYYFVVGLIGAVAVAAVILLGEGFRAERIQIWLDVENHVKGFQILQGLYAIASGGIFGTGLGQSMQKLGFIPESHNDMIFSIICEELGLFGAIFVILLFILLIWRIFVIAISAPDLYGGLICSGVLIHIAIQVVINIAVVTNSMPSTGIPLPFISYGGTSIAILLAEMGIVLSVSNQIKS